MKSVTEFPSYILVKGNEAKAALVAEGKTPEEVQVSLGATFKYEGDKLKYFINALDVAAKNAEGLVRVMILRLNEGESFQGKPESGKGVQVEDLCYLPEFRVVVDPNAASKKSSKGGRGKGRQGRGGGEARGLKESPWGLSPEQKAAKRSSEKAAAAARKA